MTDEEWVVIDQTAGMLQAELLRGLLEAEGISVVLLQEGAGRAIGLTVGTLGRVQMLVKPEDAPRARQALDEYYRELSTPVEGDTGEAESIEDSFDEINPDDIDEAGSGDTASPPPGDEGQAQGG